MSALEAFEALQEKILQFKVDKIEVKWLKIVQQGKSVSHITIRLKCKDGVKRTVNYRQELIEGELLVRGWLDGEAKEAEADPEKQVAHFQWLSKAFDIALTQKAPA